MKIVVLDAYTLNPGERRWEELEELGEVVVHDRTAQLDVVRRAKDAEVVLTNKTILDGFILNLLPKLKYIGVLATGYNVVDLDVARSVESLLPIFLHIVHNRLPRWLLRIC